MGPHPPEGEPVSRELGPPPRVVEVGRGAADSAERLLLGFVGLLLAGLSVGWLVWLFE